MRVRVTVDNSLQKEEELTVLSKTCISWLFMDLAHSGQQLDFLASFLNLSRIPPAPSTAVTALQDLRFSPGTKNITRNLLYRSPKLLLCIMHSSLWGTDIDRLGQRFKSFSDLLIQA